MWPLELGATYFSKWQRSITHGGNAHHTIFLYHLSTMHRPPSIVHFQSGYKDGLNRLWSHSISSHFAADSVFSFGFVSDVSIFFRGGGGGVGRGGLYHQLVDSACGSRTSLHSMGHWQLWPCSPSPSWFVLPSFPGLCIYLLSFCLSESHWIPVILSS